MNRYGALAFALMLLGLPWQVQAEDAGAKQRVKTALVLSGGGARGLAHVGVVNALDRLRIPYDCIAGTSMGAIAGGTYAAGTSLAEAERLVVEADWRAVFADKPRRRDIPYFRKYEDYKPYFDFTLILDGLQLKAPRNFVGVQHIGLFFSELAGANVEKSFDELPIPFRAVATDIENGDAVVIDDGSLTLAMRASMSIPGVFPPIHYKDHLLVDGGLAMNLPVSVGRELCGEEARVIAVNVSTPAYRKDELNSFLSISEQAASIGMKRNFEEQRALLTADDILIEPVLDGLSSMEFERVREFVAAGEKSVNDRAADLSAFQVSEEEYEAWKENIAARKRPLPVIDHVKVGETRWVNAAVMKDFLDVPVGKEFSMTDLHKNISRVYARGDFSRIHYDLTETVPGHADITINPEEKQGRDFVRFGISLYSNFEGDANFSAIASLRRAWLNRLDAEWRTDILLGRDKSITSEWYQPTSLGSEFFIAPRIYFEDRYQDAFSAASIKNEIRHKKTGVDLEIGSVFGRWGEVRLGLARAVSDLNATTLPFLLAGSTEIQEGGYTLRTVYDQLDSTRFPHKGSSAYLTYYRSQPNLGAEQRYESVDFRAFRAKTKGQNTLLMTLHVADSLGTTLPFHKGIQVGGMFNLSAFPAGYYSGDQLLYGSLIAYRRISELPSMIGRGIYAGMMLESARLDGNIAGLKPLNDIAYSGGAYLAADTIVGPFYLMASIGSEHQASLYMALGIRF